MTQDQYDQSIDLEIECLCNVLRRCENALGLHHAEITLFCEYALG